MGLLDRPKMHMAETIPLLEVVGCGLKKGVPRAEWEDDSTARCTSCIQSPGYAGSGAIITIVGAQESRQYVTQKGRLVSLNGFTAQCGIDTCTRYDRKKTARLKMQELLSQAERINRARKRWAKRYDGNGKD